MENPTHSPRVFAKATTFAVVAALGIAAPMPAMAVGNNNPVAVGENLEILAGASTAISTDSLLLNDTDVDGAPSASTLLSPIPRTEP